MAASGFDHLGPDERRSLFRLREACVPVAEITSRLGRHRSMIHRELARNRYRDRENAGDRRCDISGYYPVTAQDQALARERRLAKLARHEDLLAHVVDRLRAGWSPPQIAGRLRLDGVSGADGKAGRRLCHETIYRHVYGPKGGWSSSTCACLGAADPERRGMAASPGAAAFRPSARSRAGRRRWRPARASAIGRATC